MCHISINILPYPAFILSQDLEVLAFNQPAITFLQDPKQNILGQSFDTICQNINIADPFSNIKSFDIFDQSPHKTITVCAGNKLNQPFNWIISAMYHAEMQQKCLYRIYRKFN